MTINLIFLISINDQKFLHSRNKIQLSFCVVNKVTAEGVTVEFGSMLTIFLLICVDFFWEKIVI